MAKCKQSTKTVTKTIQEEVPTGEYQLTLTEVEAQLLRSILYYGLAGRGFHDHGGDILNALRDCLGGYPKVIVKRDETNIIVERFPFGDSYDD